MHLELETHACKILSIIFIYLYNINISSVKFRKYNHGLVQCTGIWSVWALLSNLYSIQGGEERGFKNGS